jgi:hypothetical protein
MSGARQEKHEKYNTISMLLGYRRDRIVKLTVSNETGLGHELQRKMLGRVFCPHR